MNPSALRPTLSVVFSLCGLAAAQAPTTPVRFVAEPAMVRLAVHDLPALLSALPGMHLGKLLAEPDVAAAFTFGLASYAKRVNLWHSACEALLELAPEHVTGIDLTDRAILQLDWHDLHSLEMLALQNEGGQRFETLSIARIEPTAAGEARFAEVYAGLAKAMTQVVPLGASQLKLAAQQEVDGYPALVFEPHEAAPANRYGEGNGLWMMHLPGQFVGGNGAPATAGKCRRAAPAAPGIELEIDFVAYLSLLFGLQTVAGGIAEDPRIPTMLQHWGLASEGPFRWQVQPAGELIQDELSVPIGERAQGVLGALVNSVAPLVAQPLPESALLQIRLGFDVPSLRQALDALLQEAQMPTLDAIGADLNRAWTGGLALAAARPGPGGVLPRVYASFGIVDELALARLLAMLPSVPGITTKAVTLADLPCVQLRLGNLPAGIQPCYCVKDGVLHIAESSASLRLLLQAAAGGAPPALDLGTLARPTGKGALLPGFDLRFDGAALYAAIHELWLPLAAKAAGSTNEPLVPMAEMPDIEVVTPHLGKGRGVLRRLPDRLVLSMVGSAGGPELHAFLDLFGPMLSGPMTNSWQWRTAQLQAHLARAKLAKVHAAIEAFRQRTGQRPGSLAELLAGKDLADPSLLWVEGDELAEPVAMDGTQIAKSSFRYYPEGIKISPQGKEITARLVMIKAIRWQRFAVDLDGTCHEGWGEFASATVEELEKKR